MKDRQQREQGAHAHRWQLLRGHTSEIENQRESAPPVMWCRHMRSCHSGHARLYTDPPIFGFRFSVFAISIPRLRTHAGAVASSRLVRRGLYSVCFSSALHTAARPGPRPRQRDYRYRYRYRSFESDIRPRIKHAAVAVGADPGVPRCAGPMRSKQSASLYARDVNWPRPLRGS